MIETGRKDAVHAALFINHKVGKGKTQQQKTSVITDIPF